jgi:hypothetical protein
VQEVLTKVCSRVPAESFLEPDYSRDWPRLEVSWVEQMAKTVEMETVPDV